MIRPPSIADKIEPETVWNGSGFIKVLRSRRTVWGAVFVGASIILTLLCSCLFSVPERSDTTIEETIELVHDAGIVLVSSRPQTIKHVFELKNSKSAGIDSLKLYTQSCGCTKIDDSNVAEGIQPGATALVPVSATVHAYSGIGSRAWTAILRSELGAPRWYKLKLTASLAPTLEILGPEVQDLTLADDTSCAKFHLITRSMSGGAVVSPCSVSCTGGQVSVTRRDSLVQHGIIEEHLEFEVRPPDLPDQILSARNHSVEGRCQFGDMDRSWKVNWKRKNLVEVKPGTILIPFSTHDSASRPISRVVFCSSTLDFKIRSVNGVGISLAVKDVTYTRRTKDYTAKVEFELISPASGQQPHLSIDYLIDGHESTVILPVSLIQ